MMDVGSGDDSGGETPLPIPNRAVKPTSANGTAPETGWKSRSSPGHEMVSCHLQSKQMAAFLTPTEKKGSQNKNDIDRVYKSR